MGERFQLKIYKKNRKQSENETFLPQIFNDKSQTNSKLNWKIRLLVFIDFLKGFIMKFKKVKVSDHTISM